MGIYLDTDERRRFAQVSHEYLIEQLQYQNESVGQNFKLNFNHPVKELIWCGDRGDDKSVHGGPSNPQALNVATAVGNERRIRHMTADEGADITLKLNGHERFAKRHNNYFTRTQVWQHHHEL